MNELSPLSLLACQWASELKTEVEQLLEQSVPMSKDSTFVSVIAERAVLPRFNIKTRSSLGSMEKTRRLYEKDMDSFKIIFGVFFSTSYVSASSSKRSKLNVPSCFGHRSDSQCACNLEEIRFHLQSLFSYYPCQNASTSIPLLPATQGLMWG